MIVQAKPVGQLVLVVAILSAADIVGRWGPWPWADLAVPTCAAIVLALSRWFGLSWAELGLSRGTWRSGLLWGAISAGAITLFIVLAAALPLTRSIFLDDRYRTDTASALRYALFSIPLLTVIPEEVAFRGVILGLVNRSYGRRSGVIWSSLLFGLWHITSSIGLGPQNAGLSSHLSSGMLANVVPVIGAVLVTACAGLVFCWMCWRSGSLLAPVGLHWALNSAAMLTSAAVWALTT